jgi:DinB superfamily
VGQHQGSLRRTGKTSSIKLKVMATNFKTYFKHYIDLVIASEPMAALGKTHLEFSDLLKNVDEEQGRYSYAQGKWTIKEVIAHIIDAERVFAYRAMSFARNDRTDLAGFDDHLYAQNSGANSRSMTELLQEFDILRQASVAMFNSFDEAMWTREGTANGITIDVKSLAYLIAGHCRHHGNILRERYGI